MKKVEYKCLDCRVKFTITFRKSIPPWSLMCPVCGDRVEKIKNEEN